MSELEKQIEKHTNEENLPALDKLFESINLSGSSKEKEQLADGYISYFGQCHYDYMCGKFNKKVWIQELEDIPDKIKQLWPGFNDYFYYKAHVFEMYSSVAKQKQEKIDCLQKCLQYLQKQHDVNGNDVRLLLDIADNTIELCKSKDEFPLGKIQEAKQFYIKAFHLEQKEEHQHNFFGLNGSAIHSFLNTTYDLLFLPIKNAQKLYDDYFTSLKSVVYSYANTDPLNYYHWADTLLYVTERAITEKQKQLPEKRIKQLWEELLHVLPLITDLKHENEFFYTSIGNLFEKVGSYHKNLELYETASKYYMQAFSLNRKSWSNPTYLAKVLIKMAYVYLGNNNSNKAKELFLQGLDVFVQAQKGFDDFQLSLNYGNHLFEYAKVFEQFSKKETLKEAQKQFEHSKSLANDFYTQPYYGLAKTLLKLGEKEECLKVLKKCGKIFSNEYHIHDFKEIVSDEDFDEVKEDIVKISDDLQKENNK